MVYKKDLGHIQQVLEGMSEDSRLWIFQAERALQQEEENHIEQRLEQFLSQWTSHNRQLIARGTVAFDHFLIIALDESKSSAASGCSIDAMTHQIQDLSKHLGLNLLDRSTFYFLTEDSIKGVPMQALGAAVSEGKVSTETPVFNNLIAKKRDLPTQWMVPLNESWHKRFL